MADFSTVVVTQNTQAVVLTTVQQVVQVNSSVPGSYRSAPMLGFGIYSIKDPAYGAVGDGTTDDTTAIQGALTACATAGGGVVYCPPGTYLFTNTLTVGAQVTLQGQGYATNSGDSERAPACLVKSGSFLGVDLTGAGAVLESIQVDGATGNGGDGVRVANQRVTLRDVSVTRMGGVGVRIGVTTTNCNLWRLTNVYALGNTGHGVYIHDPDASAPDVNGGLMEGLDSRLNGGDGLNIDNAFDNNFFGVSCQSNTGYGIRLVGTASRLCTGQCFWFPYTENNTAGDILVDTNAKYSTIFGYRTGSLTNDAITDNGAQSLILGHYGSDLPGPYFRSAVQFANLLINSAAISGQWTLRQNTTTRNLEIAATNTSATPLVVSLLHDSSGVVALAIGSAPATTGAVRIGNGDNVAALNAAGNGNVVLVRLSSADIVQVGSSGAAEVQLIRGTDAVRFLSGGHWAPAVANTQDSGTTALGWRTVNTRRTVSTGTAHVAGDYAASANWGTTPTITPVATDMGGRVSVLAQATTGANPTLALTFKDGTWTNPPAITCSRGDTNAVAGYWVLSSVSATVATWTFVGTPTAGQTYILDFQATGK